MQSYPINVTSSGGQTFSTAARRFVYESGVTSPIGGDARIIVKPDTGNEIMLRPGQSFGLAPGESAANWYVRANDPTAQIIGTAIIGSGDFQDGTFKVDSSTGTIAVRPEGGFQIMNTTENRVPVALDPATEKAMREFPILTYNASRTAKNLNSGATARQVLDPADNLNGVIVEWVEPTKNAECALLAKATMPASQSDGDVLTGYLYGGVSYGSRQEWKRMKVDAGKGLWAWVYTGAAGSDLSVLLTIL